MKGVAVGTGVGVAVSTGVGVAVGTGAGVAVGAVVGVAVGTGVGVDVGISVTTGDGETCGGLLSGFFLQAVSEKQTAISSIAMLNFFIVDFEK